MQDIRKSSNPSRSNVRDIPTRSLQLESKIYRDDEDGVFENSRINNKEIYRTNTPHIRAPHNYNGDKKSNFGTWAFIGFLAFVISGILLLNYVFNSSTITITPKYNDLTVNKTMQLFSSYENQVKFIVSTTTLSKSRTLPKSDTKKVESKASGKIIIYNNYSTASQKLIKNTRLESSQGKIYRITESVTVPGMKGITPGSVEVTAFADSYGSDYNIPPSDFTIPGFKDTPRFVGFFGRSKGVMSGGASGNQALVSVSDLNATKDEFAISLNKDLQDALRKLKKEGYVPSYDQIQIYFNDNSGDILSGATADYTENAVGYLLFINKDDLATYLAKNQPGISQYNGEKMHLTYEDTMHFTLKTGADLSKDKDLEVLVEGTPRLIWDINQEQLKQTVVGKDNFNVADLKTIFTGIEKAEVNYFPFWFKKFSSKLSAIDVVVKIPTR